jgi:hypothetical protein
VRALAPELGYYGQALILGQEALLRCERIAPDLDLQRRTGWMLRIQSVPLPHAEQMTASWVRGSCRKTMATVQ